MRRADARKPKVTRRAWLRGALAAGALGGCEPRRPRLPFDPRLAPDGGLFGTLEPPRPRSYATFEHGVASGDPLADAVVLWTRVTPGGPDEAPEERYEVRYEVARDPRFEAVVVADVTSAEARRDWTVKLDVGGLAPATTYYYRFHARGDVSPVGRTRTAPDGSAERLRFALASCASLGHGFFHAYSAIARRDDLDAVIHLGDYLYEYASGTYGLRRALEPAQALVGLMQYRARYAQYRREPSLAEAHRRHPWITVWDDHESANDSWPGGAENHDPWREGPWEDRLAAAMRAYREWMPVRDGADPRRLFRALPFGELCELVVLDTRAWGRTAQVWDDHDPRRHEVERELLGADQHAWLFERLARTRARWKLVAQQVMLSHVRGIPHADQWDGYPAARARLLRDLEASRPRDVVFLTGDVHSSWAFDVAASPFDAAAYDPATGRGALAVEIVTPAVSSPGLDAGSAARLVASHPHLAWANLSARGFVVVDLDAERARADWIHVGDVEDEHDETETLAASFETRAGVSHLVPTPP
ncbi:MAG: alkaline phosphatase D family protein [Sandaracinaceae bacterium]|nr:alkaline phosphatase D family protein [Sandaracinaceae bacterium]